MVLYVFDGTNFIQTGRIQGPQGIPGAKAKTVKLSPSKHVINYSTDETETDTIIFTATPQNIEGTATYKYHINNVPQGEKSETSTFTLPDDKEPSNGESVVVKVKLYDDGVLVATDEVSIYGVKDGYSPVRGTDYNSGDNVRVEYSIDGENWVTTQVNGTIYYHIRTAVQINGEGDYIPGLATKFVPELGVDYNNGSYLHIKYSDNGTSFTKPLETPERAKIWRDSELKGSDFIVPLIDYPNYAAWITYRQELRDWPSTDAFPDTKPTI